MRSLGRSRVIKSAVIAVVHRRCDQRTDKQGNLRAHTCNSVIGHTSMLNLGRATLWIWKKLKWLIVEVKRRRLARFFQAQHHKSCSILQQRKSDRLDLLLKASQSKSILKDRKLHKPLQRPRQRITECESLTSLPMHCSTQTQTSVSKTKSDDSQIHWTRT